MHIPLFIFSFMHVSLSLQSINNFKEYCAMWINMPRYKRFRKTKDTAQPSILAQIAFHLVELA